jgi:hypothetical protein
MWHREKGKAVMKYPTNQILKVWDDVLPKVARNVSDATDQEIAAASEIVCAKLPCLRLTT